MACGSAAAQASRALRIAPGFASGSGSTAGRASIGDSATHSRRAARNRVGWVITAADTFMTDESNDGSSGGPGCAHLGSKRVEHGWWGQAVRPRLAIARQVRVAGGGLVAALVVVNLLLGLLPVVFVVATSWLVGRIPAIVSAGASAGAGTPAWNAFLAPFLLAGAAFVGQQALAPVQVALGELMKRRVDGWVHGRIMAAALRRTDLGAMEDPDALDALGDASRRLTGNWETPGMACAGLVALLGRYVRLLGLCVVVGVDGQVAGSEERSDRRERRVVKRMCHAEPEEGGYAGAAGGGGGRDRVEAGTQPTGHQIGRRRTQTRRQFVLLGVLLGRCAGRRIPVDRARRRRDRRSRLPVQHSSPLDPRAQPCHDTLPAESLPGTVT
ncbi:hypothetical protein GCM10009558_029910 [Virgisporangium aurantiacum]